jgi:alkanesulfonate monooxygenase SsuD/methylene tetrahydromethanopterin reductase-like flavin-dependent oxidoreductase (luciferase family)
LRAVPAAKEAPGRRTFPMGSLVAVKPPPPPGRSQQLAVPAVASPTGPKLAGMHGVGLLSIGATTAAGFDAQTR